MSIFKEVSGVPISEKILLSKDEAAEMLSISVRGIERLMKTTDIPYVRIGGRVLFHRELLNKWAIGIKDIEGEKNGQ